MEFIASFPRDDGMYLVMRIRPGWMAIGFYLPVEGGLHLADLSIVPGDPPDFFDIPSGYEPGRVHGGNWLNDFNYLKRARQSRAIESTKPPKAVYSRLLRLVQLEEMQQRAEADAQSNAKLAREMQRRGGPRWSETMVRFADALEGSEHDITEAELDYLRAAARFAALNTTDSNESIAQTLGVTANQLRDHLNAARKHGYLTSPGRGRRGGELTELGHALAARHLRRKR